MKKTLISLFFCTLVFTAFSQKHRQVDNRLFTAGFNYRESTKIEGSEHEFTGRIHKLEIDKDGKFATIHLRDSTKNKKGLKDSGTCLFYDLLEKRVVWTIKINYNQTSIYYKGNHVIRQGISNASVLNSENGKENWIRQILLFHINDKNQLGLGYNYSLLYPNPTSNKLLGINMLTGKTIWKREIERKYGWNSVKSLNDSILLIASGGLHTVNLHNGKGWSYNTPTGIPREDDLAAVGTAIVAMSALFSGYILVPLGEDIIGGIESNALVDSTGIYHASAEKISRLNFDGETVWSRQLDKAKCSQSQIIHTNKYIYLYNKGALYDRNKLRIFGTPFLAVFNEHDGSTVYYDYFKDKNLILNHLRINNDTTSLLFNNKFMQISLKNKSILLEKQFDSDINGQPLLFVNDKIFNLNNGKFDLTAPTNSGYLVRTDSNKLFWLDNSFEIERELNPDDYYILHSTLPNHLLFHKNRHMCITDQNRNLIAEFESDDNAKYNNGILYSTRGNIMKVINLNELLEK